MRTSCQGPARVLGCGQGHSLWVRGWCEVADLEEKHAFLTSPDLFGASPGPGFLF